MELSWTKFKKLLIFQEKLPKPQKPKLITLLQKELRINFPKTVLDNSFHLFKLNQAELSCFKLNQTILLVYKTLKAFFVLNLFSAFRYFFLYISSLLFIFIILPNFSQTFIYLLKIF